jgi:tetratricopeptide (TPR) repeat protein
LAFGPGCSIGQLACVVLLAAAAASCRSGGGGHAAGGSSPSPVAQDPKKEDPVKPTAADAPQPAESAEVGAARAMCTPSGAACFDRAQSTSEKEPLKAERELEACLGCDDAPPASYRLLATLREDRNARAEAREALILGVRRHPSSVLLWRGLSRIEIALGHGKAGIEAIAYAHRLTPSDEDIEREYKDTLARFGTDEDRIAADVDRLILEAAGRAEINDFKGAAETLQAALQKGAKVPRCAALVHQRIGLLSLRRGNRKDALAELEKALGSVPDSNALRAETLVSYSEVLLALNRADDAMRAANEAIRIEPKNALAHANLGIARAVKNDREGAMQSLSAAVELGLARRLTLAEFLAIGPPIDKLKNHPDFAPMVHRAWPKSQYPPDPPAKKK